MSSGLRAALALVTAVAVTGGCALFLIDQGLGWTVIAALLGALVYSVLSISLAEEGEPESDRAEQAGEQSAAEGSRETVQS